MKIYQINFFQATSFYCKVIPDCASDSLCHALLYRLSYELRIDTYKNTLPTCLHRHVLYKYVLHVQHARFDIDGELHDGTAL